jgi:hypothetical protein
VFGLLLGRGVFGFLFLSRGFLRGFCLFVSKFLDLLQGRVSFAFAIRNNLLCFLDSFCLRVISPLYFLTTLGREFTTTCAFCQKAIWQLTTFWNPLLSAWLLFFLLFIIRKKKLSSHAQQKKIEHQSLVFFLRRPE